MHRERTDKKANTLRAESGARKLIKKGRTETHTTTTTAEQIKRPRKGFHLVLLSTLFPFFCLLVHAFISVLSSPQVSTPTTRIDFLSPTALAPCCDFVHITAEVSTKFGLGWGGLSFGLSAVLRSIHHQNQGNEKKSFFLILILRSILRIMILHPNHLHHHIKRSEKGRRRLSLPFFSTPRLGSDDVWQ